MKVIIGFILEYLLIVKIHLESLAKRVPDKWQIGNKGDVIILPGFGEPWWFLGSIGNYVNQLGFRVHTIPKFNYNTQSIDQSVRILHDYIEHKQLQDIIFISHSKGGIIAKRYLDIAPNSANVECSLSIACPYQGTNWGYLYLFSLAELRPNSRLIKQLLSKTTTTAKIVNLYAHWDNHIIPNRNALLPGAANHIVNIVGHTRILFAPRTYEVISEYLRTR